MDDRHGNPDTLPVAVWLVLPLASALVLAAIEIWYPRWAVVWIHSENGALEMIHFLMMLGAAILALRILAMPHLYGSPWLALWAAIAALGSLYVAGEEISWGQNLFGWLTPEFWRAINDQGETNLHNVSSWLDQKPRALLEAGVIVGGILLPLLALRYPRIRQGRFGLIVPPLACWPSAVLAEVTYRFDLAGDFWGKSSPFGRESEVQELFFYFFILLYLVVFRRRLRRLGPA
jgi:hypothetical protein